MADPCNQPDYAGPEFAAAVLAVTDPPTPTTDEEAACATATCHLCALEDGSEWWETVFDPETGRCCWRPTAAITERNTACQRCHTATIGDGDYVFTGTDEPDTFSNLGSFSFPVDNDCPVTIDISGYAKLRPQILADDRFMTFQPQVMFSSEGIWRNLSAPSTYGSLCCDTVDDRFVPFSNCVEVPPGTHTVDWRWRLTSSVGVGTPDPADIISPLQSRLTLKHVEADCEC